MPEILSRVDLDTVTVCLRRCREFFIKLRVLPKGQTLLLVLEMAEVPQNLFNARIVTEHLWHRNEESDTGRDTDIVAPTFHDDRVSVKKRAKDMKLDFPCSIRPFVVHWLGFVNIKM